MTTNSFLWFFGNFFWLVHAVAPKCKQRHTIATTRTPDWYRAGRREQDWRSDDGQGFELWICPRICEVSRTRTLSCLSSGLTGSHRSCVSLGFRSRTAIIARPTCAISTQSADAWPAGKLNDPRSRSLHLVGLQVPRREDRPRKLQATACDQPGDPSERMRARELAAQGTLTTRTAVGWGTKHALSHVSKRMPDPAPQQLVWLTATSVLCTVHVICLRRFVSLEKRMFANLVVGADVFVVQNRRDVLVPRHLRSCTVSVILYEYVVSKSAGSLCMASFRMQAGSIAGSQI